MSTRCQVRIKEYGVNDPNEEFTLYHHCDGYPSGMVPLIAGAYQKDWKHGRVGKVASYVIAEDVDGYEMEQGHELHGDIEWYYVLEVESEMHVGAIPTWYLTVYDVPFDAKKVTEMRKVFHGTIQEAVALAEEMERSDDES